MGTPSEAEVLAGIAEVARRQAGLPGQLSPQARLVEDLALDSLKLLALAVEVENHFQVKIEADEETEIRTVGDLVRVVRRKLEARAHG